LAVSFRGRNAATSNTRHDFYVELSGLFYHYWLALSIYLPTYNPSVLPKLEPMRLARRPQPFDHPDWLYEIKFDGALAYVEAGKCRLVSRRVMNTNPKWLSQRISRVDHRRLGDQEQMSHAELD